MIFWFKDISKKDLPRVGGKNVSLGEMTRNLSKKGVQIPAGFALTTRAYGYFLKFNQLDRKLKEVFRRFESKNIRGLQETGRTARDLILKSRFPQDLRKEIIRSYRKLSKTYKQRETDVAVRSSGVAEDAPTMSFAGQFETFLNVSGEENLLKAIKRCWASAFNDRVIAYREEKKVPHLKFAISVGIQKMVRSDLGSAGVMFTLDTETGFDKVVLINSIFGVGEMIVKGKVTPDEFYVFKPTLKKGFKPIIVKNLGSKRTKYVYLKRGGLKEVALPKKAQTKFSLTEPDILTLAQWACLIEEYYGIPQDIEWAKDGKTGQLFIVQSRPETVFTPKQIRSLEEYRLKTEKKPILTGTAVGNKIGSGKVRIIKHVSKISQFKKGEVLVTQMTDPDWVPVFPLASAIITEEGGKTSHAAIVSRELGLPCIVGVKQATRVLRPGQLVTVDCTQGSKGRVFSGRIPYRIKRYNLERVPQLKTKIMVNIGAPEIAFKSSFLPVQGVGLAREEFIIAEKIRIHPLALYHFKKLRDEKIKAQIEKLTLEHKNKKEYFIKELAEGIAQIAAAFYPKEVIVRFSDFKTNEYRNLLGGHLFEQKESNPMLGFRGASRYLDPEFQPAFQMECRAINRVRQVFGLKNVSVMVPFCRTVEEGKKVRRLINRFGLKDVKVYVMCEIPSNVILVEEFLDVFDGMSIGSNDLTQLILGLDRDNAKIAAIADERNEAVKRQVAEVIKICRKRKKYCGICGDAPSTFGGFAKFLADHKIPSISLSPDAVMKTIFILAQEQVKR